MVFKSRKNTTGGSGGVTTINGETGAITLESLGGTVAITTPTANTINFEVSGTGDVLSVSNSDGTLTISPTVGNVVASLNLNHANDWLQKQSFNGGAAFPTFVNNGLLTNDSSGNVGYIPGVTLGQIPIAQGAGNDVAFATVFGDASMNNSGQVTVGGIQGIPVTITSIATNNILQYNGTAFVNIAPSALVLTSGSSILYGNGSGGFSNVTIGSNLTFSGGTLSASATTSLAFSAITSGTNTTAAMVVGAGASLNYTSTGAINASTLETYAVGTSGGTIPLLNSINTWSALQTFGNNISIGGASYNITSLTTGNIQQYNGTNWVNVASTSIYPNVNAYSVLGNNTSSTAAASSEQLIILGTPGYTTSGINYAQLTASSNNFAQVSLQNTNSGSSASSDFIVTADTGNDTTNYADFGINNSTGGVAPFTNALAAYHYTLTNELDIGALGSNGVINFYTTGGTSPVIALSISKFQVPTFASAPIITSFASGYGPIVNQGTGGFNYVSVGTAGRMFLDQGASANPAWEAMSGDGTLTGGGALSVTGISHVTSGVLNVANGGTGANSFTAYTVICAGTTSTGAYQAVSGVGTAGQVLTSNGASALPTWQNSSGGSSFTAITSGTNTTAAMVVGSGATLSTSGTGTITATAMAASGLTGQVPVANGGTGDATLTANSVLLGAGTGAIQFATIGTAGRLLIDQGASTNPAFEAMSGDATIASSGAITVTKTNGRSIAQTIGVSGTSSSTSGGTAEVNLAAIKIPANTLNANGLITVVPVYNATGTSATNTYIIRLSTASGGTAGTAYLNAAAAGNDSYRPYTTIWNANATNSQVGHAAQSAGFGIGVANVVTSSISTTSDCYININAQPGNSGTTVALVGYVVTVTNP